MKTPPQEFPKIRWIKEAMSRAGLSYIEPPLSRMQQGQGYGEVERQHVNTEEDPRIWVGRKEV